MNLFKAIVSATVFSLTISFGVIAQTNVPTTLEPGIAGTSSGEGSSTTTTTTTSTTSTE